MTKPFSHIADAATAKEIKLLSKKLRKTAGIELRRAQARVINTIARKAKTQTLRTVSKELGIKNKDLRYTSQTANAAGKRNERLKINRATARKGEAVLSASPKGIPLSKLKIRQTKKGVKAGSRKIIDGAFIATPTTSPKRSTKGRGNMPASFAGKTQVFTRRGKEAYPLRQHYVSVSRRLKSGMDSQTQAIMQREAAVMMKKELEYRIAKLAGFK